MVNFLHNSIKLVSLGLFSGVVYVGVGYLI
jgi:hypothetical protein